MRTVHVSGCCRKMTFKAFSLHSNWQMIESAAAVEQALVKKGSHDKAELMQRHTLCTLRHPLLLKPRRTRHAQRLPFASSTLRDAVSLPCCGWSKRLPVRYLACTIYMPTHLRNGGSLQATSRLISAGSALSLSSCHLPRVSAGLQGRHGGPCSTGKGRIGKGQMTRTKR